MCIMYIIYTHTHTYIYIYMCIHIHIDINVHIQTCVQEVLKVQGMSVTLCNGFVGCNFFVLKRLEQSPIRVSSREIP